MSDYIWHDKDNPLKTENPLSTILKFGSYLTQNILRLHCKGQSVIAG
jgi:hypothetical protein